MQQKLKDDSESLIDHQQPLSEKSTKSEEQTNDALSRLYKLPDRVRKIKEKTPQLDEHALKLLREQVRVTKGLPSTLVRQGKKVICYMDSPEVRPRSNMTNDSRNKHIRQWMEDRKQSEDNKFTARCVSDKF